METEDRIVRARTLFELIELDRRQAVDDYKIHKGLMRRLDLHGVRHEQARQDLIRFIESLWNSDTEVEIITGHSPEMRKIVTDVLDEYKLRYHVGGFLGMKPAVITTEI